jgi:hypothetical protein
MAIGHSGYHASNQKFCHPPKFSRQPELSRRYANSAKIDRSVIMFEWLSFFSALSAAPATLKFASDAVEFYSKVKALRLPQPHRPLVESDSFSRFERHEIARMYSAIEKSRPVAADIATRALRFYLVAGSSVVAILIALSVLLMSIKSLVWLLTCMAVVVVMGPIIIWALPSPIRDVVPDLNELRIPKRLDAMTESLGSAWHDMRLNTGLSVRAAGVSIPERVFLTVYSQAEAIVRVLECDLLTRELKSSISTAHETFTGRVFDTGIKIVKELALDEKLNNPEDRKTVLATAFGAAGLGDLVSSDFVGETFFALEFRALAKDDYKLRIALEQHWSSRSRK